ncbi:MAG: hypothetical protein NTV80_22080 [Verrucomicrobia bacterium]|nr:hypothetical protein [Verrucomicrobiota bacterium]
MDAVGPLPGEALGDANRLGKFYQSIIDHIDEIPKGNPIVDLAGLADTLKERALNLVKTRLANPTQIKTGVELLLDNGKQIILLAD